MGLQFILGGPGSGKTWHCLDELDARVGGAMPLYFLVPEQFSLQGERLLLAKRAANVRVQVLSFNRLAYRLFSALGGAPGRVADELTKAMVLRKILLECGGTLRYYKSAQDKAGFVDALAHTLTEMNHYCVSPDDLRARAEGDDHPTLCAKLHDLALLFEQYRAAVRGYYLLTDEMLDLLAQRLAGRAGAVPLLDGAFVWVDGFSGFTPQERRVLMQLAERAEYVGITLTTRDTAATADPLCEPPRLTRTRLERDAAQAGVALLPPLYKEANLRHGTDTALAALVQHFTAHPGSVQVHDHGGISLHGAANPYAAVLTAAAVVADWTQKGYAYREIAILCGDRPKYEKILRAAFDRLGIPLFVDTEISVLPHPLTELVRALFDMVVRNFTYESVFRFLKTGLTGIDTDDIDTLENEALARGLSGFRWQYPLKNERAERARAQLMAALKGFPRSGKKTVLHYAQAVYTLLYALDIPTVLARKFDEAMARGDAETARTHKQIWPKIAEIFDKLVEVLGEVRIPVQDFAALLDAGLVQAHLGRIPPTLNQVVLGDATRSRYPAIRGMIVLGANEGALPATPGAPGLFTEDERELLRNTDLELAPDDTERMGEQYYALFCALAQPTTTLAFIYANAEATGAPLRPAAVLRSLRTLFPGLRATPVQPLAEYAPLEAPAETPAPRLSATAAVFPEILYTSASRLEAYARCPFAYYITYLLRARPRKLYEVLPTDLGNLFHEAVAQYARRYGWQPRTKAEIDAIITPLVAELTAAEDAAYHGSARNRHILEKARRTCTASIWALTEQLQADLYTPAYSEIALPALPPMPLENNRGVVLTGRIDRVDLQPTPQATYVKIIDYKSGNTQFRPEDVQTGTRLQLPLYLGAMLQHPDIPRAQPGSLAYFPIDDPLIKTDILLPEPVREAALLKAFKPAEIDPTPQLLETAQATLQRLSTQLTNGKIPAAPGTTNKKSPCDYCVYTAICKREGEGV